MKAFGSSITLLFRSWFWILQIIIGSICLVLSIIVLFYGVDTSAGAYIWLFLTGVGLMILGAERIVSGLTAKGVKKSSRIINIVVGSGLVVYIGSGFFFSRDCNQMAYNFSRIWFACQWSYPDCKGIEKERW